MNPTRAIVEACRVGGGGRRDTYVRGAAISHTQRANGSRGLAVFRGAPFPAQFQRTPVPASPHQVLISDLPAAALRSPDLP